jgi:hypothetical protein
VGCSSSDEPAGSGVSNAGSPATGSIGGSSNGTGGSSSGPVGAAGTILSLAGTSPMAEGGSAGAVSQVITMLPADFTGTDIGGFKLGEALGSGGSGGEYAGGGAGSAGAPANGNCGNVLRGVVRDFDRQDKGGNPDFESPTFWGNMVTKNLVDGAIGSDQKPVYASKCELGSPGPASVCPYGAQTTTATNFDQWYRDTPSRNQPFAVSLHLQRRRDLHLPG